MAVMIPEYPRKCEASSLEVEMFRALEKGLPNDYYVIHSFRTTEVNKGVLHEKEIDFVIVNQTKGILCLECKAGQVTCENGVWKYGTGQVMNYDGPFNQADQSKFELLRYVKEKGFENLTWKCKFLHAVWFPSLKRFKLEQMRHNLPPEFSPELVLTKEDLDNPTNTIEKIFAITLKSGTETSLTDEEFKQLLNGVLCPKFSIAVSAVAEGELYKVVFHRLLNEQTNILNFLVDQPVAAIRGVAGTGKTMIAIEKAKRHANDKERVLFLCYNEKLKEYLRKNYDNQFIDFYNIDGYACKLCNTSKANYQRASELLENMYGTNNFPYKHIIIDEAQDFGRDGIDKSNILQNLYALITSELINGTFYAFYDKLQIVQSEKVPEFIENLDCRLVLYRNCRNTENIAVTSVRSLSNQKIQLMDDAIKGVPVKIHYCEDQITRFEMVMDELLEKEYKDIVIITCKTEKSSAIASLIRGGKYKNKFLFTTYKKFKGLEADVVVLMDVDRNTFVDGDKYCFYVGASRARLVLHVIATLSDDDCREILRDVIHYDVKITNPKKNFAESLGAISCPKS